MVVQLIATTSLLWVGMMLGITLANWAKFRASGLTKPIGLEVGREIFTVFNQIQVILLIFIIVMSFMAHLSYPNWLLICMLSVILGLQLLWLFPILNKRVKMALAGEQLMPSSVHAWYGIMELIKCICLIILSVKDGFCLNFY